MILACVSYFYSNFASLVFLIQKKSYLIRFQYHFSLVRCCFVNKFLVL